MPLPSIIAFALFFYALGACVGSFLNVVIWRLPYRGREVIFLQKTGKMTLSWPPSHCPICDSPIRWYQNIPVFSWIFLRARCANCKTSIPVRYPLVELGTGILFVAFFLAYFVAHWPNPNALPGNWIFTNLRTDALPFALHLVFIAALLAASAIDADLYIIPLSIPYFIMFLGILAAIFIDHPAIPALAPGSSLIRPVLGATLGLILANILLLFGVLPRSFSGEMIDSEKTEPDATPASPPADKTLEYSAPNTPSPKTTDEQPLSPPPKLTRFAPSLIATAILLLLNIPAWAFLSAERASLITVITGIAIFLLGVLPRDAGQLDVTDEVMEEISAPHVRREIIKEIPFFALPILGALIAHLARIPMPAEPWLLRLIACCLGILSGGGIVWLIRIAGTLGFNKEAMGMGDAHLMAGVGAILGAPYVLIAFLMAPFVALLWAAVLKILGKPNVLPFGPWLSVASILGLLVCNSILGWYVGLLFPVGPT
ncbi:MAG TPA: A24 family peptidase [Phycisphaerae bacterium]|nr:A24 family peptidase [Phycisphaerae bacterium]